MEQLDISAKLHQLQVNFAYRCKRYSLIKLRHISAIKAYLDSLCRISFPRLGIFRIKCPRFYILHDRPVLQIKEIGRNLSKALFAFLFVRREDHPP